MLLLSVLSVIHDACASGALQTLLQLNRGNINKEVKNIYHLPRFIGGKKTTPLRFEDRSHSTESEIPKQIWELKDLSDNYIYPEKF